MMQEESILTENSSSVSMKELNLSQVFNKYRSSKASSSSYNSLNSERLKSIMKTCEQSYFIGYSICSDPRFLYCIAKITVRSQVDIEDGMCAVDDYLRIVQNGESSWKSVLKGLVVKGKLLFLAGDTISAHEILNDVVQEARRLELGTIESLALESIQSFNLY
jgi:hypothetical protein